MIILLLVRRMVVSEFGQQIKKNQF